MSVNLDRLQAAGIATETPLKEPYSSIIEELSAEEVEALLSIKRRFDRQSDVELHQADDAGRPDEFFALI